MVINSNLSGNFNFENAAYKNEQDLDNVKGYSSSDVYVAKDSAKSVDNYASKYVNLPTKKYIDAVIKTAVDNIKYGRNVDESRRIIKIFSGIINEDSSKILMNMVYKD